MASHPRERADDMARCILRGPLPPSQEHERRAFRACISADTKTYLDKRERAHELIREVGEALDKIGNEQHLPASLAELPGLATQGPWGHPMHYRPKAPRDLEFHRYELCVLGPDGVAGSQDDICHAPAFIYFQF